MREKNKKMLLALDGIVALEPTVERLRQQGEMASRLGHTAKAVGSFLRAADLNKQNPESDGGLALYECAYKLDSGSVEARLAYGQSLLARHGLSVADLKLVLMHQANLRINEYCQKALGLPDEKVFNNIERWGNTTSATLPLAFWEARQAGKAPPGSLIAFAALGAGLHWGAVLLRV